MTTDEIFNYVMDDPEDTNPNVLKSLLNSIPTSGGGGAFIVTVTDQEVTVAGTTTTIRVCNKTAAEIYEAAKKGPVWFYYPVTQTSHDITVYYHPWFYLEVALLTDKYEFHTSSSVDMSFTFKASNGSDYPATTPTV